MKTLGWIATAALTIGLGIATPAMAREDQGRFDNGRTQHVEQRDTRTERSVEVRHDEIQRDVVVHDRPIIVNHDRFIDRPVIVDRPYINVLPAPVIVADCNQPIAIPDLPLCVTDTITLQGRGPIDSVQFVTWNGAQFYDVVVGHGVHFDMHIDLGGNLLSLNAV